MKAKFLMALLVTACVIGLQPMAHAGSIHVQVPHDFSVGKTTMPAGSYTIVKVKPEGSNILFIRSDENNSAIFVVPITFDSQKDGASALQLIHNDNDYVLSEINTPQGTYYISGNSRHQVPDTQNKADMTTGQ